MWEVNLRLICASALWQREILAAALAHEFVCSESTTWRIPVHQRLERRPHWPHSLKSLARAHELLVFSRITTVACFPPQDFNLMYLEQIRLSWLTFGVAFESNLHVTSDFCTASSAFCASSSSLGFASETSATRLRQLLPAMGGGSSVWRLGMLAWTEKSVEPSNYISELCCFLIWRRCFFGRLKLNIAAHPLILEPMFSLRLKLHPTHSWRKRHFIV